MSKSFFDVFTALDADIYCFQETKLQTDDGGIDIPGYTQYLNSAVRKGYAGTALLTLRKPAAVYCGIGLEPFDSEGRVITADYGVFYLINCYTPHAAPDLSRLQERITWDQAFLTFLHNLDQIKPVILCGDLNAAYNSADLLGQTQGMHVPGYTREERNGLVNILSSGFVDAYRHFHPSEKAGEFAYRKGIRAVGLDYFLVSERFIPNVADCRTHNRIKGSDHWPLELSIFE